MPPHNSHNAKPIVFSGPGSVDHTTKPYLDDLPSPRSTAFSPGQTTPTGVDIDLEDEIPTPVRPRFALNENDNDEDEEDEDEDDEDDSLDDDEFESHYSRQDSPVSSSEEDQEDEEFSRTSTDFTTDPLKRVPDTMNLSRISSAPTTFLHGSQSSTSLHRYAPPIPPPLYPPFYNRPPTPLPPSPSLTSLLRPPSLLNRSTTSTRPTTPDYSDDDTAATPNDTEAAVHHSALRAVPLPPSAPKVPTYEYYGFVLYLFSTLSFLLYILWSYLPSPILHRIGITYYPNRWWSLAIPAWIVMMLVYIYIALACWNVEILTIAMTNVEALVDSAGNVAILDDKGYLVKGGSKRFEAEAEDRKRRERSAGAKMGGSWGRSGKGKSATKRKEKRRRDKSRGRERDRGGGGGDGEVTRFGYMGDVVDGRVSNGLSWSQIWNDGTDAVMDVPIGGVCEVLYGDGGVEV